MTAPTKQDQGTSNLAIALRARETLAIEENWCTGYRHIRGRYCLTGHILTALGATRRCDTYDDPNEPNFMYREGEGGRLDAILHSLGFQDSGEAERFNDASGIHSAVLNRFDQGLKNWKDE